MMLPSLILLFSCLVDRSSEIIELFLKVFKVIAHTNEALHHLCIAVYVLLTMMQHLAGGSNFKATNLHKVIYIAYLVDVVLGILAHAVACCLRLYLRKLRLPIAKKTLGDVEHLRHLLYGVIQFLWFLGP